MARVSRRTPLFLLLDDLQWADEATLELVHYLATRVGQLPVMIVGTYRDSRLDTSPALCRTLEELLRLGLRPLKLQGLSAEAVGQMLRNLSRQEPPLQLVRVISAETHGHPFFVEELYRHLVAEEKLFDTAGALRADVSVAEIGVPDTVRLVLERRLVRLGKEARAVLTAAVAISPCFRFELLQALRDYTTPDGLLLALKQACESTAQLCAAIIHARSTDDAVHCPDDQISQARIMSEMIDGTVLAQLRDLCRYGKTLMGKSTNTVETVGLPIGVAQSDAISRDVSLQGMQGSTLV